MCRSATDTYLQTGIVIVISLTKGCSSNYAGDGPRDVVKSANEKSILKQNRERQAQERQMALDHRALERQAIVLRRQNERDMTELRRIDKQNATQLRRETIAAARTTIQDQRRAETQLRRETIAAERTTVQQQRRAERDAAAIRRQLEQEHRSNIRQQHRQQQRYRDVNQYWDYNNPCEHCGCVHLLSSLPIRRNICCMKGRAVYSEEYPRLQPLPPAILDLATNFINHMSRNSVTYNSILSLGATGIENGTGGGWERIHGDHAITLHGRTYHYLTTSTGMNGLKYFTYDALEAAKARGNSLNTAQGMRCNTQFLEQIYNELKQTNIFVKDCEQIGRLAHARMGAENTRAVYATMNQQTSNLDVAAITAENITGNAILRFKLKSSGRTSDISCSDPRQEPLIYPVLFPFGEKGWGPDLQRIYKISVNSYLASRLLMPDRDSSGNILRFLNTEGNKELETNRFQLMARLGQTYIVDQVSRAIDNRLEWVKHNQSTIMGTGPRNNNLDVENEGEDNGSDEKSFLSQSHHGSRRHLKSLAHNALCIVSECGRPSVFITVTCNPLWPEIQERLFSGQTAFDRPDVTCRVFKARLSALLNNIREHKYFGPLHSTNYLIHVIEYQHRGLPHTHIVVQFSNMPSFENKDALAAWIDKYISACVPEITNDSTPEDIKYANYVTTHMRHKCSRSFCLDENGICKKGFGNNTIQRNTSFGLRGFPMYKRLNENDLFIVPHVRAILLDWNGHANVEFAGSTYIVIYLYKYLFKGSKKVRFQLTNADDVADDNEIKLYIRGRFMCSMDAVWRVLGYDTYPKSTPTVRIIKARIPEFINTYLLSNKLTDLHVYFCRPVAYEDLKYTDFFKTYTWAKKLPIKLQTTIEGIDTYYSVHVLELDIIIYIYKRSDMSKCITRMEMLYPSSGEIWYVRLLLINRPCASFEDARSKDGVIYDTFQLSAIAHGYVTDELEALRCFESSIGFSSPAELRSLFVMLTLQGGSTLEIFHREDLQTAMLEDYQLDRGSRRMAYNDLLNDLAYRVQDEGRTLSQYGLPEPEELETELDRELVRYDANEQLLLLNNLNNQTPNTAEQQIIFNYVLQALRNNRTKMIFIQGMGGSGKSTLTKKIMAASRAEGFLTLGCASTGIAATVYENFHTAHGLFKFPVVEEEDKEVNEPPTCQLQNNPQRKELLDAAKLIVWDESLANNRDIFEDVYNVTNGFKGKVIILIGDSRQLPPVIVHGERIDIVSASIKSSYLWPRFTVFKLTQNMRLRGILDNSQERQRNYAETLLAIGEGRTDSIHAPPLCGDDNSDGHMLYALPMISHFIGDEEGIKEATEFILPGGFDPDTMYKRTILATTNEKVDKWNETIQDLNPNELRTLTSADQLAEVDDPKSILKDMLTEDILKHFNKNGVPPHILRLKVGDICIILRNLSKKDNLTNNTRVRVMAIQTYGIKVQTISSTPKVFVIPRIRFKFRLPFGESYQMIRTQFPLRLAYCMTINKSQGQEFEAVLLDLRNPPFTHGHLYVALSRVYHVDNIRIILEQKDLLFGDIMAENVVFKELLNGI